MISLPSALRSRLAAAPRPLHAAAALLLVQALGFVAFGGYELTQVAAGRVVSGIVTALLLILWGLGLAFGGWAMLGGRLLARGPVVAAEIIHLPIAWSFRGGQTTWVTLLLGLTSLAVVLLVLVPASTRHLTGAAGRP
ncbi:hypothetical protein GA0111570_10599 [Raineyella antarctica]|uniref:Uncharacterized protein n=1 Tax=Raineyella antarctica TaxID=1577474 RepID=A0A1G6GUN2_9ACTN|nr:hypothetical protein [Raineyella antarctica]SDB85732.1 hypothetical protein GA0111570_10599 [Raineyella antarctica]